LGEGRKEGFRVRRGRPKGSRRSRTRPQKERQRVYQEPLDPGKTEGAGPENRIRGGGFFMKEKAPGTDGKKADRKRS